MTCTSSDKLDPREVSESSTCFSFSSLKNLELEDEEPMESSSKIKSSKSDLSQDAPEIQVLVEPENGIQAASEPAACCLFEIDLASPVRVRQPLEVSEMLNDYRQPPSQQDCLARCDTDVQYQQQQRQHQAAQFRRPQMTLSSDTPRLAVTSRRLKEYFESLRGRSRSNGNLYQFFKSARSELVACLLFCLISSQALIVGRQFFQTSSKEDFPNASSLTTRKVEASSPIDSQSWSSVGLNSAAHLVGGLADAFTVTSLTQVFGHISGCHLIPSVSLALYIKGHISRARLAAYLGAQSLGALLGIGLLGLLTSSQIAGSNLQITRLVNSTTGEPVASSEMGAHKLAGNSPTKTRRRRDALPGNQDDPLGDFNLNDVQGSETILLSIMEQAERKTISRPASAAAQPTKAPNDQSHAHLNSDLQNKSMVDGTQAHDEYQQPPQLASAVSGRPVIRLRRRKRQRAPASAQLDPAAPSYDADDPIFVNQLHLALPDRIMAANSVIECQQEISGGSEIHRARARQICEASSNPSQMFIFQLLANLLVVLTYLANVEPRRQDAGFKSLSIGIAYALASLLTIQSGGFMGNPMHLVALVCFSNGQWRPEWLVYLVCPLVGGVFGALSHEYVDFSSLKRRNKALKLRRSFYSLDELDSTAEAGSGSKPRGGNGQVEQACELPTLSGALRAPGKQSSVSTDARPTNSPDSNVEPSSSVLTLADDSSDRKSGVSYSQQVRAEQQRLARRLRAERTRLGRRASAGAPSPLNYEANFLVGRPAAGCCR